MKYIVLVVLATTFISNALLAQVSKNDVLFTIDGDPISTKEFKRVYNKNLDLVKEESQKDIDNYLELFINYKLKLKEARALGLHEKPKYKREFANYRKQLAKNYLTDSEVTEKLIEEAYDRTVHEIKASHILIRIPETAPPQDTLKAYNTLLDARQEILSGTKFDEVAKKYSEDPTVSENGGDLGYFGGFRMVYDFENAAFNTEVGEVSQPFRTKFGYHIVKTFDKRKSLGQLTVAHIMVSNKNAKDSTKQDPKERINDLYQKLKQGEKFESLAKQFSEDKASAKKGGLLNKFAKGQLSSDEFEEAAFALKEIGDVSSPVESRFGWHIIKLVDKHPVSSFEEMKTELESKIKRGSRSKLITNAFTNKLKQNYGVEGNKEAMDYFSKVVNDSFYKRTWKAPETLPKEKTIAQIGDDIITYKDFAGYLETAQRQTRVRKPIRDIVENAYDEFLAKKVLSYHESHLEEENQEFRIIIEEYRDGLLLFDLMETQVWNAARQDSVGLMNYFKANASKYKWQRRAVATVASSNDRSVIKKVGKYLEKGWNPEKISETVNKKDRLNIMFTTDTMDITHQALPKTYDFKVGVSDVYSHDGSFVIVKASKIIESSPKTFQQAKGKVVSDYQSYIEENWLKELRKKYTVNINQKALESVRKELGS